MFSVNATIALAALVAVLGVYPIVRGLLNSSRNLFDIRNGFIVYYIIQFSAYPIYIDLGDNDYFFLSKNSFHSRYYINLVLVWACVGIFMYHLGFLLFQRRLLVKSKSNLTGDPILMPLVVTILVLIIIVSFYRSYLSNGFINYVDNFNEIRYGSMSKSQMTLYFCTALPCYTGVIFYSWVIQGGRMRTTVRLLVLSLFGVALVASFLTGFRAVMMPILLTILAVYNFNAKRFSAYSLSVVLILVLLFTSFYGSFREAFESSRSLEVEANSSSVAKLFLRSNAVDVSAVIIDKIHDGSVEPAGLIPFLYESITMIIPREFWDRKPIPQGLIFSEVIFNQPNGGISMGIIGYFFYQYGGAMVIIGMFLFGALSSVGQQIFLSRPKCLATKSIYCIIFGLYPKFAEAPQETLNQLVITTTTIVLVLIVCLKSSTNLFNLRQIITENRLK